MKGGDGGGRGSTSHGLVGEHTTSLATVDTAVDREAGLSYTEVQWKPVSTLTNIDGEAVVRSVSVDEEPATAPATFRSK